MTSLVVVWYLIINNGYHGGVIAIPQTSREQCLANAKFLNRSWTNLSLKCIPGVK